MVSYNFCDKQQLLTYTRSSAGNKFCCVRGDDLEQVSAKQ